MNLRKKTMTILGISLAALVGILYLTLRIILGTSFTHLEGDLVRQRVEGTRAALVQTVEEFSSRFADWSEWDDMCTYIQNRNQAFVDSNLVPPSLAALNLTVFKVIDASGQTVFET